MPAFWLRNKHIVWTINFTSISFLQPLEKEVMMLL